jgi:hypothetical protein
MTAMTMNSSTVSLPSLGRPLRRLSLLALALGVGVVALGGVIAWQRGGDDAATEAPAPTVQAAPTIRTTVPPPTTVYLTESAEQAAGLEQGLAYLTPATGDPIAGEVLVLAAGSVEEQDRARFTIEMLELQGDVRIIDVRPQPSAAPRGAGSGCGGGLNAGEAGLSSC